MLSGFNFFSHLAILVFKSENHKFICKQKSMQCLESSQQVHHPDFLESTHQAHLKWHKNKIKTETTSHLSSSPAKSEFEKNHFYEQIKKKRKQFYKLFISSLQLKIKKNHIYISKFTDNTMGICTYVQMCALTWKLALLPSSDELSDFQISLSTYAILWSHRKYSQKLHCNAL